MKACICVKEAVEDAFFSVVVCGFGGALVALEGAEAAQKLMEASEVADREVDGRALGDLLERSVIVVLERSEELFESLLDFWVWRG